MPDLSYGTVIEGESFFKIQQSRRLIDCFMQLALSSKVVIACRLSPKQKAEVIKLIREY
jgi:magnesium-transporting ATPase (P-type)